MSSIDITQAPPRHRSKTWSGRDEAHEGADTERWARPALVALLIVTAVAYTWNLSASGYANSFYAAAVQAGTESWKAFFFGSLDSSSFITVDKPPASLWVMALSGRIFGFSSWSMLVPQALEGVAAVALLYASVRRWFGSAAGLLAGALFAMTPVAALMFRFNNPDALLVMLLVAAAYCLTRAIENAATRWMLATGALIGFAFLAKMGQALLVVPAFTLAYAVAAPTRLRRRLGQLLGGLVALVVSCGWWVGIVALLPASSRPFIDGSPENNIFNLIFGYNGFSRLFGSGGGGGGGGASFSGSSGILRLFNSLMGGQASWLMPAALLALVVGLWLRRGHERTDRMRAAVIVWGGWLLVTAAVFSFSSGIIHTYYAVALAPAIAALVAIGGILLWRERARRWTRFVAAAMVAGSGAWAFVLLDRTPDWQPWLRPLIVTAAALATVSLVALPAGTRTLRRSWLAFTATCAAIACLSGPLAYATQTVTTLHTGSVPSAGPTAGSSGAFGGAPGLGGGGPGGGTAAGPSHALPATGGFGGGGAGGELGQRHGGRPVASLRRNANRFAAGSRSGVVASNALTVALKAHATRYRWVAATSGSSSAAALELATGGEPVMAIGGFNDNGGLLALAKFERYVRSGAIHYYVVSGGGGLQLRNSSTSAIEDWVESHFSAETIGGETVYDLTR